MHGTGITHDRARRVGTAALALAAACAACLLIPPRAPADETASTGPSELVRVTSLDRSIADPVPGSVYVPDGPGPFPAVVLLHGCSGVEKSDRGWAKWFQQAGYVVLLLDSLAPRHTASNPTCTIGRPTFTDQTLDAYGGLAYLRSRPDVVGAHVAVMGRSHGGGATLEAISTRFFASAHVQGSDFAAGVAMYPHCASFESGGIAAPLLLLVGGEDDWEPPSACLVHAEQLKNAGAPIDWHLYPEATHAFDAPSRDLDLHSGTHTMHLRYDKEAADDAHARIATFLAQYLR